MATRADWTKRVERWKDSGLTAGQYAEETGISERSLRFWSWKLGKEAKLAGRTLGRGVRTTREAARPASPTFVEVTTSGAATGTEHFELVLGTLTVRIPPSFDEQGLRRLLDVVEKRS